MKRNLLLTSALLMATVAGVVLTSGMNADQTSVLAGSTAAHALAMEDCTHHAYGGGSPLDMLLGRKTSATLGDPVYDRKMRDEVMNQRSFFQGVKADVVILDEQHIELRNAYANSSGTIYFGKKMFYYTLHHYNELAVAGILAHEWSHRVQYTFHWDKELSNPALELEADAMSGYYMALEKGFAWNQIDAYFRSTEKTGDFAVASKQHHGTPNQRVAAAYLGVQLANESVSKGEAFSYQELHHRIIDSLNTNIIRQDNGMIAKKDGSKINQIALGQTGNKEIEAPALTAADRVKYRPYKEN
jgi:hypothetical protein